ncbi:TetR/AcrR family transcriptional regulator [uncultured Chitinophaga sp.]|jgi:Transcriptional regulator|uniref:TetR/AcrR family transcriptional regulator n=1 Tax=uncultured Chitinophaga sp. TaxID=339340 RepID=UPI002617E952|nr:TetR/AcrR family transcriptional regulator [uncultured Chitinophaga sp.]
MIAETKDEMKERILEAALKRFTHYGSAKTTMNEIAEDLGCSKASLYYYFPDKKGLHRAVLMKIAENFFAELDAIATNVVSAEATLQQISQVRADFIRRFCRLELFRILNETQPEEMQQVIKEARERDDKLVARVIKAGVESGELQVEDPQQMAILYNQAMEGLRFTVLDRPPDYIDVTPEEVDQIMAKQQLLSEIFIKALKRH